MSSIDNFEFDLVGTDQPKSPNAFQGYDSQQDPTTCDKRYMIRGSKNTYLKNTGVITPRPGLKLFGEVDGTEDGVVSSYEWRTPLGDELLIRVLESGKFQVFFNDGWVDIETFTLTNFSFATWWDTANSQDILIMVNGDESIKSWTGGLAIVASSTSSTITKTGTESWLEAGFTSTPLYEAATLNPVPTAAGTGYAVGDLLYLVPGLGVKSPAEVRVDSIGVGGAVATYSLTYGGVYGSDPASNTFMAASNGNGTGAQIQIATSNEIAKTVIINGVEYSYTGGEYTTTLTGVTPDASAIAPGSVVAQKILTIEGQPNTTLIAAFDPRTNIYTNDFVLSLNNQLIVGSLTSRVVYISSDEDYLDFSNAGDVVPGDPDFAILDDFPVGGIVRGDSAYIAAGNSSWYVVTPNTPVPSNLGTVVTKLEKQVGAANSAALGHNFIGSIGEDIIYLSQDHQLRTLGTLRNIVTPKTPSLSKSVRQELMDEDFEGGALRVIDEFIYLTAPISGTDFIYQIRDTVDDVGNLTATRLWHPPQERNVSRFFVYQGITYGYSVTYPQMYQIWDTDQWHDDTPNGNAAYTAIARFAYRQFRLRNELGSFDKVWYEGYILGRSQLLAIIYNDYQGATATQQYILSDIDGSSVLYGGDGVTPVGGALIGAKSIGGGLPYVDYQNPLPKFRAILNVNQEDCFEYALELKSELADSRWEILSLGPNGTADEQNPTWLQRS